MEKVQWKVEGMTCANCALSINKFLEKKGAKNISVNAINGDVSFDLTETGLPETLAKGVESLGYKVKDEEVKGTIEKKPFLHNNL
jgi:P-type Cu+ transporter